MKKSWDFWLVRLYTYKFTQYTTTHSISPWKEKAIQMRCMWDNHSFSQKAEIQLLQSKVLFFSLDQSVTKNQILNTNFLPKFLVFISIQKKKKKGLSYSLFELKQQQKNGWHLVFSIWFLVTDRSNEKNIEHEQTHLHQFMNQSLSEVHLS